MRNGRTTYLRCWLEARQLRGSIRQFVKDANITCVDTGPNLRLQTADGLCVPFNYGPGPVTIDPQDFILRSAMLPAAVVPV